METKWPKLKKPPIVMAIFQIVFESKEEVIIMPNDAIEIEKTLPKKYENRQTNVNLNLSAPLPIGESTIKAGANTRVYANVYHTADQKRKLEIAINQITYTDETEYNGFENFKDTISHYLRVLDGYLAGATIKRVSIRFINRFIFTEFCDATEFFKTVISATDESAISYPVVGYGFKWFSQISENIRAVVNQELNNAIVGKFNYLFDIDVLSESNLIYDRAAILSIIDGLREIKNNLFFSNLTTETIDLCNISDT